MYISYKHQFKKCSISKSAPFRPKQFTHTDYWYYDYRLLRMYKALQAFVLKCTNAIKCLKAPPRICLKCFQVGLQRIFARYFGIRMYF